VRAKGRSASSRSTSAPGGPPHFAGLPPAPERQADLQDEEILEGEPAARRLHVLEPLREVDGAVRRGHRQEVSPAAELVRQDVGRLVRVVTHDVVQELPDLALEQPLGERVDGHHPAHVDRGSLALVADLEIGAVQDDPAVLGEGLLAVEHDLLVPLEDLGEIAPPEPHGREVAALVAEGHLDRRPGAVPRRGHAEHGPLHHGRLPQGQLVEGHERPTILVVPGKVVQRVPHRPDLEPLEKTGLLGPDPPEVLEGRVEAGGCPGNRAHGAGARGRARRQACLTSAPMV
jgi:hypothetical protein